jgi:hypothetical protein
MSNRTEAEILADTLDFTRGLNKWYVSLLKGTDMKQQFELNGIKLNSPLWIVAHLAWAEDFLILKSTGGKPTEISWLKNFGLGSSPDEALLPDLKEALDALKAIHEASLAHIKTLTDAQLDEPTLTGVNFGVDSKRRVIQHAIRHEGTHSGHLGWICKLQGVRTV